MRFCQKDELKDGIAATLNAPKNNQAFCRECLTRENDRRASSRGNKGLLSRRRQARRPHDSRSAVFTVLLISQPSTGSTPPATEVELWDLETSQVLEQHSFSPELTSTLTDHGIDTERDVPGPEPSDREPDPGNGESGPPNGEALGTESSILVESCNS